MQLYYNSTIVLCQYKYGIFLASHYSQHFNAVPPVIWHLKVTHEGRIYYCFLAGVYAKMLSCERIHQNYKRGSYPAYNRVKAQRPVYL